MLNRYVSRKPTGQSKRGDATSGTEAGHIFGYGLMNAIATHTPGQILNLKNDHIIHIDIDSDIEFRFYICSVSDLKQVVHDHLLVYRSFIVT